MLTPQLALQQLNQDTDQLVALLKDAHRCQAEQQKRIKQLSLLCVGLATVMVVESVAVAFVLW